MNDVTPRVSICLPVRNGRQSLAKAIDSVLDQDLRDLEIVISDNASDDGTQEILQAYARRDPRVRVLLQARNVGILENVNAVFRAARGEFVRLLGSDDWLEPQCLSRCVEALDSHPEAIGVTMGFEGHFDSGETRRGEACGEVPDSPDPVRRLARMLWFYRADPLLYDPMYGLYRREALARTGLVRMMTNNDQMLTAELALQGPILHLPDCLAHRSRGYASSREALLQRLHPTRWRELEYSPLRTGRVLLGIVAEAGLTSVDFARCLPLVVHFTASHAKRRYRKKVHRFRRRRGLDRKGLMRMRERLTRRTS